MKRLSTFLCVLALLFVGGGSVKAEVRTDWDPSDAFSTTWTAATNTLSWNKNWANVLYTGFAPKVNGNTTEVDLSKYQKIHYKITSLSGTASDANGAYIDLKVRSTGKADLTIKLYEGEHDILFKDYAETIDFSKFLEATVSATYADGAEDGAPGSAVIPEMYLYTDRWEIQQQQQTVYDYALGTALSLSGIVTNNTLVSIASGTSILYGTHADNQIYLASLADAMDKVDARGSSESTYRFRIEEATDGTLPSGVTKLYRIKAYKGDGSVVYTGPWGGDGYLNDIGWTYNIAGSDDGCYFVIAPVAGKDNTYKISSYKKNGTLRHENIYDKGEWFFNVVTQTQQQKDVDVWVEVQGADTEDPGVPAVADGWVSLITNGDLSGNDVSSFWTKEEGDSPAIAAVINATAGRMNGRGIKVTTKDGATNDWGTQFFIKSSEKLKEGQKLHIEFDYRADRAQNAATQVHRAPGDYNANIDAIDFTVNWQHYTKDITITSAMCKQDGGTGDFSLQSFGLNLSHIKSTTNFYFDNLVMWTEDDPLKPQKVALQNAITKGNNQNPFAKTTASFAVLTDAISAGEDELANASATAQSLTDAADAIDAAIAGFVLEDSYVNLTTDMYHEWSGIGADATITGNGSRSLVLNSTLSQGALVYGDVNVDWKQYAKLVNPKNLIILGTTGQEFGARTDRTENNATLTQLDVTLDASGKGIIDLSDKTTVRINAIKRNWDGKTGVATDLIVEYKPLNAEVGAAGFASFSADLNARAVGAKAYAAKVENNKVILTEVEEIPAGNAVIIGGAQDTYQFPVLNKAAAISNNDLQVSDGTVTGNGNIYALSKKSGVVGFHKVHSGTAVPAGKAYLDISGGAPEFMPLFGNETTGVTEVSGQKEDVRSEYFNLAGQRVAQPTKGLYIVNGKKVIIK